MTDVRCRDEDDLDAPTCGPRPLSQAVASASLSQLVRNTRGRVVMGTMTLSSLQLSDISVLSTYAHLQRIILDNNLLTTLAPLSGLGNVVHLSAVGNQLTERESFPHLYGSSTTLETVDLSHNKLTSLAGVHRLNFLTVLKVSANELTSVASSDVGSLTSLQCLVADSNKIRMIEKGAFRKCPLQRVSFSGNQLDSIVPFLEVAPTLLELRLNQNVIMHINEIVEFRRLCLFECAANYIYDMREAFLLADLPALRRASLIGNPLNTDALSGVAGHEDDVKSDIVRADQEALPPADGLANKRQRAVPVAIRVPALKQAHNAPYKADSPEEEDHREKARLSADQKYRLMILWRVPQLLQFDGVDVTEVEAAHARNLEGGVDRAQRMNIRLKHVGAEGSGVDVRQLPSTFPIQASAGSAALALRRGQGL